MPPDTMVRNLKAKGDVIAKFQCRREKTDHFSLGTQIETSVKAGRIRIQVAENHKITLSLNNSVVGKDVSPADIANVVAYSPPADVHIVRPGVIQFNIAGESARIAERRSVDRQNLIDPHLRFAHHGSKA